MVQLRYEIKTRLLNILFEFQFHNGSIKIEQNPELAVQLRATGTKTIAESGRHTFFANGISITHKVILNMQQWTGQSKLGDVLMTVRRELTS